MFGDFQEVTLYHDQPEQRLAVQVADGVLSKPQQFCHDFIETLRKLGITEFTITNQSTALMENIYGFIAEGCTMVGTHTITKKSLRWGEEEYETAQGILFKVN